MMGVPGKPDSKDGGIWSPSSRTAFRRCRSASIEEDTPMIWRSHGYLARRSCSRTNWVDLDYLITDLPPAPATSS
jgi:hypothetical protein